MPSLEPQEVVSSSIFWPFKIRPFVSNTRPLSPTNGNAYLYSPLRGQVVAKFVSPCSIRSEQKKLAHSIRRRTIKSFSESRAGVTTKGGRASSCRYETVPGQLIPSDPGGMQADGRLRSWSTTELLVTEAFLGKLFSRGRR